jgi:hypothetical protein
LEVKGWNLSKGDINNRGQKSVDVASTYVEVLIGLASGIIVAIIGFYPTLLTIKDFDFLLLKISLSLFGGSIAFGLAGLGSLVKAISEYDIDIPPSKTRVNMVVLVQLGLFVIGIFLMIYILPIDPTLAK